MEIHFFPSSLDPSAIFAIDRSEAFLESQEFELWLSQLFDDIDILLG